MPPRRRRSVTGSHTHCANLASLCTLYWMLTSSRTSMLPRRPPGASSLSRINKPHLSRQPQREAARLRRHATRSRGVWAAKDIRRRWPCCVRLWQRRRSIDTSDYYGPPSQPDHSRSTGAYRRDLLIVTRSAVVQTDRDPAFSPEELTERSTTICAIWFGCAGVVNLRLLLSPLSADRGDHSRRRWAC